jgi:hypothetical protein
MHIMFPAAFSVLQNNTPPLHMFLVCVWRHESGLNLLNLFTSKSAGCTSILLPVCLRSISETSGEVAMLLR